MSLSRKQMPCAAAASCKRVHDLLDRVGDGIDALDLEQLLDTAETDERHGGVAVLALDSLRREVLPQGLRHAAEQVEILDVRDFGDACQGDRGWRRQ